MGRLLTAYSHQIPFNMFPRAGSLSMLWSALRSMGDTQTQPSRLGRRFRFHGLEQKVSVELHLINGTGLPVTT